MADLSECAMTKTILQASSRSTFLYRSPVYLGNQDTIESTWRDWFDILQWLDRRLLVPCLTFLSPQVSHNRVGLELCYVSEVAVKLLDIIYVDISTRGMNWITFWSPKSRVLPLFEERTGKHPSLCYFQKLGDPLNFPFV